MTVAIAHHPPQRLPMSPIDTNTRRLSARLQKKEASHSQHHGDDTTAEGSKPSSTAGSRKRKVQYDEDDDGFAFSRVKKNKKSKQDADDKSRAAMLPVQNEANIKTAQAKQMNSTPVKPEPEPRKRRNKMSFSTPNVREEIPQRRSKRLSSETRDRTQTPPLVVDQTIKRDKRKNEDTSRHHTSRSAGEKKTTTKMPSATTNATSDDHAATKIALPMSDTPVIRRNKAMREGRSSRGERRSSLGLRGRRASSLIDTGNSNALPHHEVAIGDFYKHIESEQMEPRRMRQLLTWCATRSMHAKPQGSEFDDTHKIMSARAIEEELLKELSNRSNLSDWFTREDIQISVAELPQRPNPKNIQNTNKIAELEQQIQRLRIEKDALQELLRPPTIAVLPQLSTRKDSSNPEIDNTLLAEEDIAALRMLQSSSSYSQGIAKRINSITASLGPVVDTFADGVHKVAQYRTAADDVASHVLSICAEKLADREREGRRRALQSNGERQAAQDMSSVLRGLSRVDR